MLYILHFDKNDDEDERFNGEEMRIDLGAFPKQNTHIRLRMVGFNTNQKSGDVHIRFPDLEPQYMEEEIIDETDSQEIKGIVIQACEGSIWGDNRPRQANNVLRDTSGGLGNFSRSSDNRVFDLHLGRLDTQKDYFRVIVNARKARDDNVNLNTLNNVSVVLEVHHGSISG